MILYLLLAADVALFLSLAGVIFRAGRALQKLDDTAAEVERLRNKLNGNGNGRKRLGYRRGNGSTA